MRTTCRSGRAAGGPGSAAQLARTAATKVTMTARTMVNILHILNGDAPRPAMEQSSVPGTFSAWPDVLHEGPTPLATGEAWIRARTGSFHGALDEPDDDDFVERYRATDAVLESWRDRYEVVFWFEHDLF